MCSEHNWSGSARVGVVVITICFAPELASQELTTLEAGSVPKRKTTWGRNFFAKSSSRKIESAAATTNLLGTRAPLRGSASTGQLRVSARRKIDSTR